MKYTDKILFYFLFSFFIFLLWYNSSFADNINSINKNAWSDQVWWINFKTTNWNINITDTSITWNAWSDQVWWINLNPTKWWLKNTKINNPTLWCILNVLWNAWNSQLWWIDFNNTYIDANWYFKWTAKWAKFWTIAFSGMNFKLQTDFKPNCTPPVISWSSSWSGWGSGWRRWYKEIKKEEVKKEEVKKKNLQKKKLKKKNLQTKNLQIKKLQIKKLQIKKLQTKKLQTKKLQTKKLQIKFVINILRIMSFLEKIIILKLLKKFKHI
jgi:hypothetical protein